MRPFPDIAARRENKLNAQCGFGLLEALVTIVVVSVGLLGILGLQTASIVNTRISTFRSNATILADNFAERMRANPQGDYGDIESITDFSTVTTSDVPTCDDAGTPCSPDDITEHAIYQWSLTLQRKLPNAEGYVDCVDDDAGCDSGSYYITVAWSERSPDDEDDLCQAGPHKGLAKRCIVTEVRP